MIMTEVMARLVNEFGNQCYNCGECPDSAFDRYRKILDNQMMAKSELIKAIERLEKQINENHQANNSSHRG